jgi:hypothetical protein
MIEQRPPRDLYHRFRQMVGQGPHALPEAGGENHGFGGFDGHFQEFLERVIALMTNHITTPSPALRFSRGQ